MILLNSPRRPELRDLLVLLFCLDVLLPLATCMLGFLWFYNKPLWIFAEDNYEPATVIVGGLAAFTIAASVVVRYRLAPRTTSATTPSTGPVTELWMRTNHSQPVIRYTPLQNDDRALIAETLCRHYRSRVTWVSFGSRIDEDSGTANYRIKPSSGAPLLCRVHRRIKSEMTLQTLHAVQRHIHGTGVFSDSRLSEALLPISSDDGTEYVQSGGRFVVLFPFAENVTHYSGATLAELSGLAHAYGRVQKALQSVNCDLDLEALSHTRPDISWFLGDEYLFELVCENNKRAAKAANPDAFVTTFRDHADFLRSIWAEVKPLIKRDERHARPLLHDFHPHNTFFEREQCLLIYDYEAVSHYWSESEAVGFALHRFVREFIRLDRERGNARTTEEIHPLGEVFLEGYSEGRGSLPSDILGNVGLFIKKTNLAKLTGIMAWWYELLGKDPGGRRRETMYAELQKFIMYLREAEQFGSL